jgi:hypothetical protein
MGHLPNVAAQHSGGPLFGGPYSAAPIRRPLFGGPYSAVLIAAARCDTFAPARGVDTRLK